MPIWVGPMGLVRRHSGVSFGVPKIGWGVPLGE